MAQMDQNAHATSIDIDNDGEAEVVLKNQALFVVATPRWGGRIVAMYSVAGGRGAMVIGNPCDDWNWMEDLNRYMDVPRNHPGALADAGFEHDAYEPEVIQEAGFALLRMKNIQEDSRAFGLIKEIELRGGSAGLVVRYILPPALHHIDIESALSPDYLHLLRSGIQSLEMVSERRVRGCRAGDVTVWIAPKTPAAYKTPFQERCGHGAVIRLSASTREICFEIGVTRTGAISAAAESETTVMEAV
jgi:hypothetical protein